MELCHRAAAYVGSEQCYVMILVVRNVIDVEVTARKGSASSQCESVMLRVMQGQYRRYVEVLMVVW
jgi:hypothetical protein